LESFNPGYDDHSQKKFKILAYSMSGGEQQILSLARALMMNPKLLVLDEPSIGLHQRDQKRLINTLIHLRDLGNTVIVVEHDEETMLEADYLIDVGPRAGIHGGEITAAGTPEEVMENENSITGQYLSKKKVITERGENEFISISRGYYLQDGSKGWKSSITLPNEKDKREEIAKLILTMC